MANLLSLGSHIAQLGKGRSASFRYPKGDENPFPGLKLKVKNLGDEKFVVTGVNNRECLSGNGVRRALNCMNRDQCEHCVTEIPFGSAGSVTAPKNVFLAGKCSSNDVVKLH